MKTNYFAAHYDGATKTGGLVGFYMGGRIGQGCKAGGLGGWGLPHKCPRIDRFGGRLLGRCGRGLSARVAVRAGRANLLLRCLPLVELALVNKPLSDHASEQLGLRGALLKQPVSGSGCLAGRNALCRFRLTPASA